MRRADWRDAIGRRHTYGRFLRRCCSREVSDIARSKLSQKLRASRMPDFSSGKVASDCRPHGIAKVLPLFPVRMWVGKQRTARSTCSVVIYSCQGIWIHRKAAQLEVGTWRRPCLVDLAGEKLNSYSKNFISN